MSQAGLLSVKQVIGVRSSVTNGLAFQDEQTVVYIAGGNIVLYGIDQKAQRVIPCSINAQALTTMTVSPNRRVIAIAERINDRPQVTIYDLQSGKRRKTLQSELIKSNEIVSLLFSSDSKYLLTQGGAPDYTLIYWSWEKGKVMAHIDVKPPTGPQANATVNQVSFNPQDNTQICTIGHGLFKMFRYAESALKPSQNLKQEHFNFTCHCWISDDRLLAGTDQGKLFVIQNGEILHEIKIDSKAEPRSVTSHHTSDERLGLVESSMDINISTDHSIKSEIKCIIPFSRGVLVAAGVNKVYMYDRVDDNREYFRRNREILLPIDLNDKSNNERVVSMCLSPSEETLVALTDHQQIYQLSFSGIDITKDVATFSYLTEGYHHAQVTGVDTCVRKQLIATCGVDRSVRLWNYETGTLEVCKEFQEEAYTVSIHPSGLFILVGFSDKLKLFTILIDDLRPFKEFSIRGCREALFSNGGHLFAAVHGNVIQIYSTVTFENITNLKGHNGKVRQLIWSPDDTRLFSCGMDGAVYEWEVATSKRLHEAVLKACGYTGLGLSADSKTVFAVGTDRKIKEIVDAQQILREIQVIPDDVQPTTIALSHTGKSLLVGTSKGTVRSYKFPLTKSDEYTEYIGHVGMINRLRVTFQDEYAVSVGDDGLVILWKLQEVGVSKKEKETTYAEEILITKSDLEEKNSLIRELKQRVAELREENDYQLKLKEMNYAERIRDLTDKFMQEMENLKTKNTVITGEKEKEASKHAEQTHDLIEKQNKELQDLEGSNNQKLMLEYEKYQDLQAKTQKTQEEYERQITELENRKEEEVTRQRMQYTAQLEKLKNDLILEREKNKQQSRDHEETKRQIEEDADEEILKLMQTHEQALIECKDENANLRNKSTTFQRKVKDLEESIKKKDTDLASLKNEESKLQNAIRGLKKDIEGLKKEIQERDETIQDKEKRIYELKRKNQELEKFKFVLDYKIKELKKQIEPREIEIKEMKEQITNMEAELERLSKSNDEEKLKNEELRTKLNASALALQQEKQLKRDSELALKRIKTDIHNCSALITEPKLLTQRVAEIYAQYVRDDATEEATIDQDITKEYARQRDHLERTVRSLKGKVDKDSDRHKMENIRIMQENVTLIKEINDLRRELKTSRVKLQDLQTAMGISRKTAARTTEEIVQALNTHQNNHLVQEKQTELENLIHRQRSEIQRLNEQIANIESGVGRTGTAGGGGRSRPSSGQLPPITSALTAH
ncbi:unnamed protein product [Rotaria sordida]|uniref:EML-like second beta-propeller domain-containing protein n=1 Tax=Rotaria sordida TaxID=392033 RepID=A0A819DE37_9BILA|nr:unnamed protein product [Rotaria sordida]